MKRFVQPFPLILLALGFLPSPFGLLGDEGDGNLSAQPAFIPIDHKGEPASSGIAMFRNEGQTQDVYFEPANDVLYQSWQCTPAVFLLKDNTVPFVVYNLHEDSTVTDSIVRIDLRHVGERVNLNAQAQEFEQIPEYHNYYLTHCPNGILYVPGFKRIVYKDIYPGVDFHVYSNPWGLKFYYVINPGADPNDILLQFAGQDSLDIDYLGALKIYFQDKFLRLPNAIAYQQISGTTTLVPWGLNYQNVGGSSLVSFNFGTYDPAYPLVVDISQSLPPPPPYGAGGGGGGWQHPEWCTYYGETNTDECRDMYSWRTSDGDQLLTCGTTRSNAFPLTAGAQFDLLQGYQDAYYSVFNDQYGRDYTTFYGGAGDDVGSSIVGSHNGSNIYLTGYLATDPAFGMQANGSAYQDNTGGVFIAGFDILGQRFWGTRFDGGYRKIRTMRDGNLFLVGTRAASAGTSPPTVNTCGATVNGFPACNALGPNAYFQDSFAGGNGFFTDYDGCIARFNPQHELVWSSYFGGHGNDNVEDVIVDDANYQVFIVGSTSSVREVYTNCEEPLPGYLGFPLCNTPGSYFQENLNGDNSATSWDGYMACFTVNGELKQSTFIGGHDLDYTNAGAIDLGLNALYITGTTETDFYGANCSVPSNNGFPLCHTGAQYHSPTYNGGANDAYVVRLNTQTYALEWATFIGGGGYDYAWSAATNGKNEVAIAGYTSSGHAGSMDIPTWYNPNYFQQLSHDPVGEKDGFLWIFNGANAPLMGTYHGGSGNDELLRVAFNGDASDRVYVGGKSNSASQFPFWCPSTVNPYCYNTYVTVSSNYTEVFYSQIQYDVYVGLEEGPSRDSDASVFPNPASDQVQIQLSSTSANRSHLKIILRATPGSFPGIRRCSTLTERPAMRGSRA